MEKQHQKKDEQYVYILSNPYYGNRLKVGRSTNHPEVRAKELSRLTGVIGEFYVEWSIEVPDSKSAEAMAHFVLKEYKFQKEFFSIDLNLAIEKLLVNLTRQFKIEKPEIYKGSKSSFAPTLPITTNQTKLKFRDENDEIEILKAQISRLESEKLHLEKGLCDVKKFIVTNPEIYFEQIWEEAHFLAKSAADVTKKEFGSSKISWGFITFPVNNLFSNWLINSDHAVIKVFQDGHENKEFGHDFDSEYPVSLKLEIPFTYLSYECQSAYVEEFKRVMKDNYVTCHYWVAETAEGYAAVMGLDYPSKNA